MTAHGQQARWWHPMNKWLGARRPVTWMFSHTMHHLDPLTYRLTNGRYTAIGALAGLPVLIVTTTGARSGKERSLPLVGFPDGENLGLIASNWGRSYAPGWYYNLRAKPTATVTVDNHARRYMAHEATADEYEMFWQQAIGLYAGYASYRERAGRHIPIMVLTPVADPEADT